MAENTMTFIEKYSAVQQELKAPKGQYNSFGKYKYRSQEDILEAVKPLLGKYGLAMTISDEIVSIADRIYVKATVILTDATAQLANTAFAREEKEKKGMDGSQVTGTASSYARKYALNGMFLIDDTKDADTDEYGKQVGKKEPPMTQEEHARASYPSEEEMRAFVLENYDAENLQKMMDYYKVEKLEDLKFEQLVVVYNRKASHK